MLYGKGVRVVVPLLVSSAACVIPPSLSVDKQDAGINSPPAILIVRSDQTDLAEGDIAIFQRGSGTLSLTLIDTDLNDTLFGRVFVNYTVEHTTAPRSACTATVGAAQRTATCFLDALCLPEDDNLGPTALDMTVVVFDREPLDTGSPAFQAMPPDGLSASKFFHLECQPPPT
jgi:hypothetical protein